MKMRLLILDFKIRCFIQRHRSQMFLLSVLLFTVFMAACSLPEWISAAQSILPIVGQMAAGVLALIAAFTGGPDAAAIGIISTVLTDGSKALSDVQAMVEEYNSNPSTTLLGSIENGVKAVMDNISKTLADTGITNTALQAKVAAVLQLMLSELTSWSSLIPVMSAKAGDKFMLTVPMGSKQFKQAYNAILATLTGDPAVDGSLAKLKKL